MRKKALITGITGQDGSYLTELLLEKDYEIHGIIRKSSNFGTGRIEHLYENPKIRDKTLHLHYGDALDVDSVRSVLRKVKPDEIYNLAAQSHVAVSFALSDYTSKVNGNFLHSFLDAVKEIVPECRFYQASTSELFGASPPPQDENTSMKPRSPYAISKLAAYWTVDMFREAYGMFAVNGILFNHESPRRNETFVTRKISAAAARIKLGRQDKLVLGNLKSIRDWGYAPEYVNAMWMMLQSEKPVNYVVATGVGATVQEFCQHVFEYVGLDWEKHVVIAPDYLRPLEVEELVGNPGQIEADLGWRPKTLWRQVAEIMVENDLVNQIR